LTTPAAGDRSPQALVDGAQSRQAVIVGAVCYLLWGATPILFMALGRAGADAWEIVGQRAMWSAPWAALLVFATGQGPELWRILRQPRTVGLLALSAASVSSGWMVFVWAVNHGRNLESSLGYYINPLMNMAAGAVFFRERIDRIGLAAIALAAIGVTVQTIALGHPPVVALFLATTFWIYGLIRRQVDADALAGLCVECLLLAGPGVAFVVWLHLHGGGMFGRALGSSLLMSLVGPATVFPLALFSWTARRLPFSTIGFIQFLSPTVSFIIGLAVGEHLSPLGMASFVFIWAGTVVYAFGAWRASRRVQRPE
jgi:chloramphenicol-sensitive protein RarD